MYTLGSYSILVEFSDSVGGFYGSGKAPWLCKPTFLTERLGLNPCMALNREAQVRMAFRL